MTRWLALAAIAAAVASTESFADNESQWRWSNVSRVVAFADVHGAYDTLIALLQDLQVIDEEAHWSGGNTHLGSLGDLLDRGDDSRKVLDLIMRLQHEAAAAGGRVHAVLGNHEMMNMIGDLRYVSEGEYAAFAGEEPPGVRERRWQSFLHNHTAEQKEFAERGVGDTDIDDLVAEAMEGLDQAAGAMSPEAAQLAFDQKYPPGYFGHRAAFAPSGQYGRWLLARPLLIVINETAFVHGGLPPVVAAMDGSTLNEQLSAQLIGYLELWSQLLEVGLLDEDEGPDARFATVRNWLETEAALESPLRNTAEQFARLEDATVFNMAGPLWYRGTAICHPLPEIPLLEAALERLGARRVVMGHTVTRTRRVTSRMDGRAIMLDTGMLEQAYQGRPSAVVIEGDRVQVHYQGEAGLVDPVAQQRRVGSRPNDMSADELEVFLRTAAIVDTEEVGIGVTKPERVTLRQGDTKLRAIFRSEDLLPMDRPGSHLNREIDVSDRFRYEVAAYRLDRLLGLDMVPIAVLREIDGVEGSLQLWVENAIDDHQRRQQGTGFSGWCPMGPQYQLMYAFDTLIFNTDRTQENVLYTKDDWALHLIDHTRAFRSNRGLPPIADDVQLSLSPEFAERMGALNEEQLNEALGDVLKRKQIAALIRRRDEILEKWPRAPLPQS